MSNYEERLMLTDLRTENNRTKQTLKVNRKELLLLLSRSLNTMEPQTHPKWAMPLCDLLEQSSIDVVLEVR